MSPKQKNVVIIFLSLLCAALLLAPSVRKNERQDAELTPKIPEKTYFYTDRENGYSFKAYPGDVTVHENGVSIGIKDGPGNSVEVFSDETKEEWIEKNNARLAASRYIIDKRVSVAGQEGLWLYETSDSEEFRSPAKVLFEKDEKLFVITASLESIQGIIDSFELTK